MRQKMPRVQPKMATPAGTKAQRDDEAVAAGMRGTAGHCEDQLLYDCVRW